MVKQYEIPVTEIGMVQIGHAQNEEAGTGVTVLYFPDGADAGCMISGGGPASRETPLLMPNTADNRIHAIVLSGGSAFGLAASDGVMSCLEEHGIGYPTGFANVPLVCQSCIYDLSYKRSDIRPDAAMGRAACEKALAGTDGRCGCIGAGTGATVGKILGMKYATKTGLGCFAMQIGEVQILAIVVINAYGDIIDPDTGKKIAGVKNPEGEGFSDTRMLMSQSLEKKDLFNGNTTIGCIVTNAAFNKAEMNKIAAMATQSYSRCIYPVATMGDGDTVYAASTGNIEADINVVGMLAAEAMKQAILRAVQEEKK